MNGGARQDLTAKIGHCHMASGEVISVSACSVLAKNYATGDEDLKLTLNYGGERQPDKVGR